MLCPMPALLPCISNHNLSLLRGSYRYIRHNLFRKEYVIFPIRSAAFPMSSLLVNVSTTFSDSHVRPDVPPHTLHSTSIATLLASLCDTVFLKFLIMLKHIYFSLLLLPLLTKMINKSLIDVHSSNLIFILFPYCSQKGISKVQI